MDPSLENEPSFAAANLLSCTLSEILLSSTTDMEGSGLRVDNSVLDLRQSGLADKRGNQGGRKRTDLSSEDETSKIVSVTSSGNYLNDSSEKRRKISESKSENGCSKSGETSSAGGCKPTEENSKPEPSKDYIHVRARRGQATDRHSLAERARREKISERMKILQDLVPGCNKIIGKALVLDEIINYIESLQRQVEFLSVKLEAVNSTMSMHPTAGDFHPRDLATQALDIRPMYGTQAANEHGGGSQQEWLHIQVDGNFERPT